ncbi:WW domain-containing oxidoreductase [Penicillium lagena]|uniref:WW domain-containing oxidoreductase n=1 Tax=Penicillium lagena TaxID=94218 RepID=UPI002541AB2B|nr:WW domain-containing oxidoreductase [Penicillium lagena]KAJ5605384.1 WW domain-containing oxidoreductase [Penicillium lagena]
MSTSRYIESHLHLDGPGDRRPTALQIIEDEALEGKLGGKVFVVTGVSSGIGIETVRALATTNATVYGLVRDLKKGEQALASILCPGRVELLHCDLASLESVRSCAAQLLKKPNNKLNVLIANAGVMAIQTRTTTVDGFEAQFGSNHLGHFLLFQLLKPTLLASSTSNFQSRVVALTSSGHRRYGVNFDNLNFDAPDSYTPFDAYAQSKTANIYMANYIERHYGNRGLHGLTVHPGGIWTNLGIHLPISVTQAFQSDTRLQNTFKSPEQGAATSVLAAIGKEFEGKGRIYIEDCGEWGPFEGGTHNPAYRGYASHAFDEEAEDQLWKISCELVDVYDDD